MQEDNTIGEWQGGHRCFWGTLKNQYRLLGDGRAEVQTPRGITFFVDEASLPLIAGITWNARRWKDSRMWHIVGNTPKNYTLQAKEHIQNVALGRYLMNYTGPLAVSYFDRNSLNNVVSNLRIVTHVEQSNNRSLYSSNTSGHNGLYLIKERPVWTLYWVEQKRKKRRSWKRNPEDYQIPSKILDFIAQLRSNGINGKLAPKQRVEPAYYEVRWSDEGTSKHKSFPNTEEGLRNALAFRDQKHAELNNWNGREPGWNT